VKCVVQNIIVDISVNQIGGLCTLCFLEKVTFQCYFFCTCLIVNNINAFYEDYCLLWSCLCLRLQVDENFGKKHLFKRSVMLIKDWCYYETRILGAHHGLISTYALEILVLYIFHIFHKSLNGPLAVSFGINFAAAFIFFCNLIKVLQDKLLPRGEIIICPSAGPL
jgi:hypothetical protein